MDKLVKSSVEMVLREMLADLVPEELEPRLELQVFFDPMMLATDCTTNNNNNNNNTNGTPPPVTTPPATNVCGSLDS